jgi:hypothetical protein
LHGSSLRDSPTASLVPKGQIGYQDGPEEYDTAREECQTGVYRKSDGVFYYTIHFNSLKMPTRNKEHMRKMTDNMIHTAPASAKWSHGKMPRGDDGAPLA